MTQSSSGRSVTFRLCLMMFLQYAVWGAWLPVAARYMSAPVAEGGLGFTGIEIGQILGWAGSIGAISAPFIAGQIADRYFRAERFLALLMVVGGVLKWFTAAQTSFQAWLWLSIAYGVVFMPTLALSNSIAFAHLRDATGEFPRIRVWGTIGWIAASWTFPMIWLQQNLDLGWMPPFLSGPEVEGVTSKLANALRFSGVLAFVYAGLCMLLPATPPKPGGTDTLAFARAFRLLNKRSFIVLVVASLAISTIHQIYFLQTGPFFSSIGLLDSEIGPAMTIGQFSEILIMAFLGWMLMTFGMRNVLMLGGVAYFLRYGIWAMTELPPWLLVSSQLLHGVCYACFFASAFIYVDRIAPADVRHSAQTVFGIMILGGGPVLGGFLSGYLESHFSAGNESYFPGLWLTLSLIGLAATVLLLFSFRDESEHIDPTIPDPEAEALAGELG
ncbi:MFS transporter [Engelhardtia mirabilis]|uniref:Nucleoside transporter YegT n=1 Tax=Engelhardtia mirabilis TaxID=2528011 RepID=A0A518BG68_9BACT|nr:Putative nucleoside transporter YegT [Planctomycetes bacterium Pla133]QDV00294.1 Putative nucleoside transporter YegT [Planctomycetes bacterium Pla86]